MLKRKIQVSIVSLVLCVGLAFASTNKTPEKTTQNVDQMLAAVPLPTLNAAEALDIANKYKRRDPADNSTIVAIDWCRSSDFQPRFSDGTSWNVPDNNDKYAWFVTYIDPKYGPFHVRTIVIVRVYDDGKVGSMIGIRT
jgi:hypothetical protein